MKQDAERKNIGPVADRMGGFQDFWSGVARRPKNVFTFLELVFKWSGESEIADFWFIVVIEEDIRGFDIAMNDAALMGVRKAPTNGRDEGNDFLLNDRLAVCRLEQRESRHVFHDDVKHSSNLAEIIDADEIGMIEAGHRFGFGLKSGAK